MMQRERGWALQCQWSDIWKEEVDYRGKVYYQNNISGMQHSRPPHTFQGGLLIDAPGLGKSLSILALVASDDEQRTQHAPSQGATLVIVPKSCKSSMFMVKPARSS